MPEIVHIGKTLSGDAYDIVLENGFQGLKSALSGMDPDMGMRRCLLVTDTNVAPLWLGEAEEVLSSVFGQVQTLVIPAGEAHKNMDTVRDVLRTLIENRFDRKDYAAALGGGVVGDLVGFSAAIYLRGIRFIQLPTTLLSQTDSSIGGKTGVDLDGFKNMAGAFHQPSLTYINLQALKTLPAREFSGGMAEILKHGLIRDRAYYQWLIDHASRIMSSDPSVLMEMIHRSLRIKAEVVEADPKEEGLRAILNFGHTIGHAIEKTMDFSLLHGECVALGSAAAAGISRRRGYLSPAEEKDIRENFRLFSLPVTLPDNLDAETVVQCTKLDKKMDGGQVKFILLREVGKAVIDRTVTEQEMLEAVQSLYG